MRCTRQFAAIAAALAILSACSPDTRGKPPETAAALPSPKGAYLDAKLLPDSRTFLPPPPAQGSAALARDDEASRAGLALVGSPRWELATRDADLFSPAATSALSCAAGFEIGATATPALDRLLKRSLVDFGLSTGPAKKAHMRPRPFMVNGLPSCTPSHEAGLRRDGSYPSGHSAIGFGWSLVLAGLVPDRAAEIVARGRAFGESRRICNVHWKSDIEEGRIVAAAVFPLLAANPVFQADFAAARSEIATARSIAPRRDCAAEAAALALDRTPS